MVKPTAAPAMATTAATIMACAPRAGSSTLATTRLPINHHSDGAASPRLRTPATPTRYNVATTAPETINH